jgi:hypothetical protein
MNATVKVETINAKTAEALLETLHFQQRKYSSAHVEKLSNEIAAGNFRLSSDAICIIDGRLGNGQHRLRAVVKTKIPCQFLVMRTDDETIFNILDCGLSRRVADVISWNTKSASAISAACALVCAYNNNTLRIKHRGYVGRDELIGFIAKASPELSEKMRFIRIYYNKTRLLSLAGGTALFYLVSHSSKPEFAESFMRESYVGSVRSSAASLYRERLIKNVSSTARLLTPTIIALGIKAFNSYATDAQIGTLKILETEEFPELI